MHYKLCSLDGCENKHLAKGMCSKHYQKLYSKKYREDNREYYKDKKRVWAKENYKYMAAREDHLKRKYGITLEMYDTMLAKQHGVCAICFGDNKGEVLVVDHNHITGKVRGLLCQMCNKGIGSLKTDEGTALLFSAIKYIEDTDG